MELHESGEDYLEAILMIEERKGSVRSIDIAKELHFSKPSVSRAVGLLKERGYIEVKDNGNIILLDAGREIAAKIYERHIMLTDFLIRIGVDDKTAAEDACRLEHAISEKSFACLKRYISKHN